MIIYKTMTWLLIEASQVNPIKWQIVAPDKDNFITVSPEFKCKDYFNEIVLAMDYPQIFNIYGFTTNPTTMDLGPHRDSLTVVVHNILPGWLENMNLVQNYLKEYGFPPITIESVNAPEDNKKPSFLLHIPRKYFHSYYISILTLLIRCANNSKVFNSLDAIALDLKTNYYMEEYSKIKAALTTKSIDKLPPHHLDVAYIVSDNTGNFLVKRNDKLKTELLHLHGFINWYLGV